MKIKYLQSYCLALFCLISIQLKAQESFERVYPAGENTITGLDIQHTSDGGYLTVSSFNDSATDSTAAIITKFSPKGDVDWAKHYNFSPEYTLPRAITLLENDTFALVSVEGISNPRQVLSKFTPDGNIIWSQAYSDSNVNIEANHDILNIEETNSLGIFNSVIKNGQRELRISFLDSLGMIEQATDYKTNPTGDVDFSNAKRDLDKGFIVTGQVYFPTFSAFLLKIDSLKNNSWSRRYQTNSLGSAISFSSVVSTPDSGYLAVGENIILDQNIGFILKTDSLGIPQWNKTIQLDALGLTNVFLSNIIASEDGDFVISGREDPSLLGEDFSLFILKISPDGDIRWINKYSQMNPGRKEGLIQTKDEGYAYFSAKMPEASNVIAPYLTKIDVDGVSSCEDTISFFTDTLIVQFDTLIFETEDFNNIEDITPTVTNFNEYQVPILSLEVPPPFCEGEPIEWTFDATTPGAVSYDWSTGETTDSITVTEEGMYIVDVRIETDVCYNLCDTATITTMGPPMAEIRNLGDYCADGFTILSALPVGDSFLWSTGETTQSIEVAQTGNYSVTVTNRCGSGDAMIEVTQTPPTVEIVVVENNICDNGEAILTFSSPNASNFMWSDGSVAETITVNAEDTYGITVTNGCGTGEAEIELSCEPPVCDPAIPNVFTPNNDSVNETFGVVIPDECADFVTVRALRIYNRWGQLVFETTSGQEWNGQYENKLAPSDVYVYYAEIENTTKVEGEQIEVMSGDVTLVR